MFGREVTQRIFYFFPEDVIFVFEKKNGKLSENTFVL